jgi:hypothetical protein
MTKLILALPLLVALPSCNKQLPTAQDAQDAMTRACVVTASAEALASGKQLPSQIEAFCSNPKLQAKLTNVVQQALDLNAAVVDVLPKKSAGDAGAP